MRKLSGSRQYQVSWPCRSRWTKGPRVRVDQGPQLTLAQTQTSFEAKNPPHAAESDVSLCGGRRSRNGRQWKVCRARVGPTSESAPTAPIGVVVWLDADYGSRQTPQRTQSVLLATAAHCASLR